jgi:hypothetical protein
LFFRVVVHVCGRRGHGEEREREREMGGEERGAGVGGGDERRWRRGEKGIEGWDETNDATDRTAGAKTRRRPTTPPTDDAVLITTLESPRPPANKTHLFLFVHHLARGYYGRKGSVLEKE